MACPGVAGCSAACSSALSSSPGKTTLHWVLSNAGTWNKQACVQSLQNGITAQYAGSHEACGAGTFVRICSQEHGCAVGEVEQEVWIGDAGRSHLLETGVGDARCKSRTLCM